MLDSWSFSRNISKCALFVLFYWRNVCKFEIAFYFEIFEYLAMPKFYWPLVCVKVHVWLEFHMGNSFSFWLRVQLYKNLYVLNNHFSFRSLVYVFSFKSIQIKTARIIKPCPKDQWSLERVTCQTNKQIISISQRINRLQDFFYNHWFIGGSTINTPSIHRQLQWQC